MKVADEDLVTDVIGAAIEVHRVLGPGLLESIYEAALTYELSELDFVFERQKAISVNYKGVALDMGFRADLIVEKQLVLELKTVEKFLAIHTAQLITYLKLLDIKRGFILNFNSTLMKNGIKRISI
ncbi:MAG: GxxExxY protein [Proteobacteria bacterium]|nr:MAG: GxxExxY protein [Pseudomonadota bacterium]